MNRRKRLEEKTRGLYKGARHASVGIELAVAVAIGYFGGRWLGDYLGVEPWGGVVGLILGFGAGLRGLLRAAREASRDDDDG